MSEPETNVTQFHKVVNPQERKLISRLRRIARRHGLRLIKSRSQEFHFGGPWQLQSFNIVARNMELEDAERICNELKRAR